MQGLLQARYYNISHDSSGKYLVQMQFQAKSSTTPIHQSRSEETGNALIESVITKYCVSNYKIMDQDSKFMSSLMSSFLRN